MSISIPCPKCGKSLRLPDASLLGKVGKCSKCEHKFVLKAPEPDLDEVQMELVEAPPTENPKPVQRTPQVGKAAAWVPDDTPPISAASTSETPSISFAAAPPVFAPVTDFAPAAEAHPGQLKRKLKRRIAPQQIALLVGLVVVMVIGIGSYSGLFSDGSSQKAAAKKLAAKDLPAAEPVEKVAPAAQDHKFGRPTDGKPIDLLWIPQGTRIVISMRPAELWKAGGKGYGEFMAALGPLGKAMEANMIEFLKAKPEQIEELLLCVLPGPRTAAPDFAAVVRRTKDHPFKKSDLMEGMSPVETGGVKYYANDKWAIGFPVDKMTYAIAPAKFGAEMASAAKKSHSTATELENLLRFTDRTLHFTVAFLPTVLSTHGDVLVPPNVQPLLESVRSWIASNDDVESAAWSFHITDQKFYSQILLRNRTQGPKGAIKPQTLMKTFQTHLEQTPRQVLELVQVMNPKKIGHRKIIGRVPAMVKAVQLGTKFQTDKQLVSLVYEGPERAAPNLAIGALLAWDESTRTDFNATGANSGVLAHARKPMKDLLKTQIDVDFRAEPLDNAFKFIASEAKFDVFVDGDGLKTATYTKNMAQTFKAEGVSASKAIAMLLEKYDKMCCVVDEGKRLLIVTGREKARDQNLTVTEFK